MNWISVKARLAEIGRWERHIDSVFGNYTKTDTVRTSDTSWHTASSWEFGFLRLDTSYVWTRGPRGERK